MQNSILYVYAEYLYIGYSGAPIERCSTRCSLLQTLFEFAFRLLPIRLFVYIRRGSVEVCVCARFICPRKMRVLEFCECYMCFSYLYRNSCVSCICVEPSSILLTAHSQYTHTRCGPTTERHTHRHIQRTYTK